jgi:hypothetical protein
MTMTMCRFDGLDEPVAAEGERCPSSESQLAILFAVSLRFYLFNKDGSFIGSSETEIIEVEFLDILGVR